MAEIPRLQNWNDIENVPRPVADPKAATAVSRELAEGASRLSQLFFDIGGHLTAVEAHKHKAEQQLASRFAAENATQEMFTKFVNETEAIRNGERQYSNYPDIKGFKRYGDIPIGTDDLNTVYNHLATKFREDGIKSLGAAGYGDPLSTYAFANEYDSKIAAVAKELVKDRDNRKLADLRKGFGDYVQGLKQNVADGVIGPNDAIQRYKDGFEYRASRIFSPEQQSARYADDIHDLKLTPYYTRIAEGKAPEVISDIENGKLKGLSAKELIEVKSAALDMNFKVSSKLDAELKREEHTFKIASEVRTNAVLEQIRTGKLRDGTNQEYTRSNWTQDVARLSSDDAKFLDRVLTEREREGGPGNDIQHSHQKLFIALRPDNYTPDSIAALGKARGMNSGETLDLLNEWYKAQSQQKNRENDPKHFSKNPQFKEFHSRLAQRLGEVPFAELKPADKALIAMAQIDYFNVFQGAYDRNEKLPAFEEEFNRVVKRYQPAMTMGIEETLAGTPYEKGGGYAAAAKDFLDHRISTERFIEVGNALRKMEKMKVDTSIKKSEGQ